MTPPRTDEPTIRARAAEPGYRFGDGATRTQERASCTETRTTREPSHEDGEITTGHEDAINKEERRWRSWGRARPKRRSRP